MNDKIRAKHNEDVNAGMQVIPVNKNNKGSDRWTSQAFLHQWDYRRSSFDGAGEINLTKMAVSVLHKYLECKVEKLKYQVQEVGGHVAGD